MAMALAAAAERQVQRNSGRLRCLEQFVALADLLATAESPSDVFEALVDHLSRIVDAWKAMVFRRVLEHGDSAVWRVDGGEGLGLANIDWPEDPDFPLPAVALIERETLPETEDPLKALGRAFLDRTATSRLACARINEGAIAVVADRRTARDFSPQDWDILRVASRQAAAALERLN